MQPERSRESRVLLVFFMHWNVEEARGEVHRAKEAVATKGSETV